MNRQPRPLSRVVERATIAVSVIVTWSSSPRPRFGVLPANRSANAFHRPSAEFFFAFRACSNLALAPGSR
jgi:hypothetical protein